MLGSIESDLLEGVKTKGALFTVLMDPDSHSASSFMESAERTAKNGADAFFVGGSFMGHAQADLMVANLKSLGLPVILFPGGASQVSPAADAILFTTLVSGRNPQYLIEEQIRGAIMVKTHGIEPIPCAYMLIESGATTTVEYVSNTKPIPADKPKISAVTALGAQMMGMRWAYLEAGSGAKNPVPLSHIIATKKLTNLNLIVGGGLVEPEMARERVSAGASMIVTGNLWEKSSDESLIRAFADAVHGC